MANITQEPNNEKAADFPYFLAKSKGFVSASDAKEYAKFCAEYKRVETEKNKYSSPEADKYISEIRKKAVSDPSPENIAVLAGLNPDEIRSRYASIHSDLHHALEKLCRQAKPIADKILNAAIAVARSEIARAEEENGALFARYGVTYDRNRDVLVLALERWREHAERFLGLDALRPQQIARVVGEVRVKAGLLG